MMASYFLKLAVMLPLLALLIWGSLKLTKVVQSRLHPAPEEGRRIRLAESVFLGPGMRLAVIEFRGREVLIGCTRQGLTRLADVPIDPRDDPVKCARDPIASAAPEGGE
jgi:flagellar protein FliO/FliZ